ncbi:MAG: ABC transporter permease, partial [Bacteroidota bacterium]
AKYSYVSLIPTGEGKIVAKWPYLRRSYQTKRNVSTILADTIPGTAVLALVAIAFAFVVGVALGIVSALQKNKLTDRLILFVSVIGMSGPSFFVAIIFAWLGGFVWSESFNLPVFPVVLVIFWLVAAGFYFKREGTFTIREMLKQALYAIGCGIVLHLLLELLFGDTPAISLPGTGLNMTGSLYSIDPFEGRVFTPKNIILPALTLGIRPLAVVVQLTRSSLLEVMEQDYIRTARAKGLREYQVIMRHALKNALNPVITAVSGWFASLLAGAVFVEFVFGWKGLGLEVFQALEKDDLPVVTGAVLFFAAVFVVMNVLVDALYGWLDPRVRMK